MTRETKNGKVVETTVNGSTTTIRELWTNSSGELLFRFNWIGGGFNDEWAKDEAEAVKKAEKGTSLKVDVSTIKSTTCEEWDAWNRMANMMCN